MREYSIILAVVLLHSLCSNAQNVDSLIQVGSSYRKNGKLEVAINEYKKALEIKKDFSQASYEIAYTYLMQNDYINTIKYSNRVIRSDSKKTIDALVLKGSALDYMGKHKRSIKVYTHAIKRYPQSYLLHFNLGVSYYNNSQLIDAESQFLRAIEMDKLQPSAHYMLGMLMNDEKKRVQSLLSFYFFLMLEPNTERSLEAHNLLLNLWKQNIEVDSLHPNSLRISSKTADYNEFNAIDLSVSSIYASNSWKNGKDNDEYEPLISNTSSFFSVIGCYIDSKKDVWHNLYIKFFNNLSSANQVEPFCYYISAIRDDEIISGWLESNRDKIETFSAWANSRLMDK